jgi:uncharacterized YccA/Bax inhibitor family protein
MDKVDRMSAHLALRSGNPALTANTFCQGAASADGVMTVGGTVGILFSLFVVTIAALNLVLDFDFIEEGAEQGAPAYMEWYAAFGLLVTLVWLYLEILRLLAKLQSRR